MRSMLTVFITLSALLVSPLYASEGMVKVRSAHSVSDTADRLEQALLSKGMKVFQRIDHAAGAQSGGKSLRPTQLLIFGNPKVGTPLMLCSQSIAIDLPQKALIWEDAGGAVWLAYNDPAFLKLRHGTRGCDEVFGKVSKALGNFAKAATSE